MKRLLALLLVLLLPAGALAEAWCADAALSVDEAYYAELLAAELAGLTGMEASDAAVLAEVAAGLLNGMSLHVESQEDAALFEMQLGGKTLIDLAVHTDAEQMVMTSDLMRGYGLTLPVEEYEAHPALGETDWQQIAAGMLQAAMQSMSGIGCTRTAGTFAGDAYSGGVYCDTWLLDDSDIAAILSSLLTADARQAVTAILEDSGMEADTLLSELDTRHQQVAERNAHTYIVRLVSDAAQQPVGLSATVLRGEAQLATLSVGIQADSLRIVLGTGGEDVNHWYDHLIRRESDSSWSGTVVQFTGEKDEAYAYAAAVLSDPDSLLAWTLDVTGADDGFTWRYTHDADGRGYMQPESVRSSGECTGGAFLSETELLVDDRELAVLTISAGPGEAIPAMEDSLTLCDLTSTEEEQLLLQDEIAEMLASIFSMRVMLLIPMDVLTALPSLIP